MKSIELFLVRHGNTFEAGQKAVWVGSREDLPLTKQGEDQAHQVSAFLKKSRIRPEAIYSGPLLRTKRFAEIIAADLEWSGEVEITPALIELDYGAWGGKTKEEIVAQFGNEKFQAWEERGTWPDGCGWGSSERQVLEETKNFVEQLKISPVLAVTSNGRLRYFSRLAKNPTSEKVKTGHICHVTLTAGQIEINSWNSKGTDTE